MTAVDGVDGRHRGEREGEESVSKHQPIRFSLSVKNERADAGRDGRSNLSHEAKFLGAHRDR